MIDPYNPVQTTTSEERSGVSSVPASIACPRCSFKVDPQARHCPQCGVDLAMAAAMLEGDWVATGELLPAQPVSPEQLVPRLGESLVEKGLLQATDLERALIFQREAASQGRSILIGQALMELGLVDKSTLDQTVTEQILKLQRALQDANQQLEHRVQERTRDLQQALTKLTELNQLKSNFISNISHELRTPLTNIKGYVDLLTDHSLGPLTKEQVDALHVIQRAETRLERLIDDLIQFSLAARGEMSLQLNPFSMNDQMRAVAAYSTLKARAKDIGITLNLLEDQPAVYGDEEKISWALTQLVDNALKFTPEGGKVILSTGPATDGKLLVSVQDSGIGIDAERISEIFEPFHQLDGSETRRFSGTGLGLAMVLRILESHNAGLQVRSNIGEGSTFSFHLPFYNYA